MDAPLENLCNERAQSQQPIVRKFQYIICQRRHLSWWTKYNCACTSCLQQLFASHTYAVLIQDLVLCEGETFALAYNFLQVRKRKARLKSSRNGKTYWTIAFSVNLHFGLTEFKARIKWNDNVCIRFSLSSTSHFQLNISSHHGRA